MIYTRMTNRLMSNNVINNLLINRSKLNEIQEQISSGKKVSEPSDDPTGTINILSDQNTLSQIDNYLKNIDSAYSEVEIADKAILSTIEVVHRAKELAVQASNATNGEEELSSINYEIEQIISQVKDIGNTKFGDKYIFGGLVTEEAPFQEIADGQIQYMGTPGTGNYQRMVEISKNVTVELNLPGDEIFGQYYQDPVAPPPTMTGNGLIQTLSTLSEALKSDPPDYDAIRSKLDSLNNDLSTLLNAQAQLGGSLSRLDITKSKLEDDQLTYTKRKSTIQDIDLAKSISDVQFQENALEASLAVSAKVLQSSILDYLQ